MSRLPSALLGFAGALVVALTWHFGVNITGSPEYLFPSPLRVAGQVYEDFPLLLWHLGVTLGVAVAGLSIGVILSLTLALLLARFGWVRQSALPMLVAAQAIPVVALAPYFIVWFGPGIFSRVALACILVFLPALLITLEGLRQSQGEAGRLFDVVRVKPRQRFRWLTVPMAIPAIASAIEVTAALAVIGAIVSELSGQPNGIGFVVAEATYNFNTPRAFAALLIGALGSLCLFGWVKTGTGFLRRRFAVFYEGT